MNWVEHNLVKNDDVVSVAAWQQLDWLKQGYSLRSAGNVSYRFGDAAAARAKIAAQLGVNVSTWTAMRQVHGNHVEVVDGGTEFDQTDGMITKKSNMLLTVVVADCVPLLLVDPVTKVIGVAHAGRKGTELAISTEIVNKMITQGCDSTDIQAAIGPSIGPCCYETDLWTANEQQLRQAGVQTIIRTDICTKCHNDLFFSHRGDQVEGRFAGLITHI